LEELLSSSSILGLGASFLAGVLMSFSPCILPLVPITLSIIGATTVASRSRSFSISFVFTLGIAVTYTILGIVASLLGIFFDKFFISPFTYVGLGILFLILGLSLIGIIKINLSPFSHNYSHKATLVSTFILGLLSALAMLPCNFPVLGSILALISLRKNVYYGALALFLFACGYGIVLLFLGTFTSLIAKLPKAGNWIIIINRIFGIILLAVSIYFFWKFFLVLEGGF
jgi:thiol:disulfide interchange protein DsbD